MSFGGGHGQGGRDARKGQDSDSVVMAGAILDAVLRKETSLRNAVFASPARHKSVLLKICHAAIDHKQVLERISSDVPEVTLRSSELAESEGLLLCCLYEFLFAPSGLKTTSKHLQSALERFRGPLLKAKKAVQDEGELLDKEGRLIKAQPIRLPRYVRVNTLLTTTEQVVEWLAQECWELKEFLYEEEAKEEAGEGDAKPKASKSAKRHAWVAFVDGLGETEFCRDAMVPDLLVFPHGTDLSRHWLKRECYIALQDKASCLPVLVLDPRPGKEVADICAAPGMKTLHLGAVMENSGKIHSFERDQGRFRTLCQMAEQHGLTIAALKHTDFLRVDLKAKELRKVRSALLDPPCSGSGIHNRKEFSVPDADSLARRLRGLANIQAMLLKAALSLPNIDRLVYSTCSVHQEENEHVIQEVVSSEDFGERFEVVRALPSWKHRGKGDFPFAKLCLRASPAKDRTNGFFVCLIQRKLIG